MKSKLFFFLLQYMIFGKKYNFSLAKAIIGQNIISANELQFPFIVSISLYHKTIIPNDHLCTGSLLSQKHVLTCAHCKNGRDIKLFSVIVGSSNLLRGVAHRLRTWISYMQWLFKSDNYMESKLSDISIITLKRAVNIRGFQPARISNMKIEEMYGSNVLIAGWSYVNNVTINEYLKYGYLKILTPEQCKQKVESFEVSESIMCSSINPYILLNYGDSGGPVLDMNFVILGINQGRCPKSDPNPGQINIHIGIYYYQEFIASIIN